MPWTDAVRRNSARGNRRYTGTMTDQERDLLVQFLAPALCRARTTAWRADASAILYSISTGRQWRLSPKDLLPVSTVQPAFCAGCEDRLFVRIAPHSGDARARWRNARPDPQLARATATCVRPAESGAPWAMTRTRTSRASSAITSPTRSVFSSAS